LSTPGSDPWATPSTKPADADPAALPYVVDDVREFTQQRVNGPEATWNPIPTFQPTAYPAAPPHPMVASPALAPLPPPGATVGVRSPAPHHQAPHRRRLPENPVEYPQLLRGPTRAWWRPILTLVLFVALFAVLSVLPFQIAMAYGLLTGIDDVDLWLDEQLADGSVMDPGGYLYLNLGLIVLIPASMLSIWAVHRVRPRFLSSVAGGLRWRWLLRCLLVLTPLWAVYLTISTITDPPQSPRSDQWVALLIIGLLLTPWQAAAEEYAFRGWLTQNVGAYFARPMLAFVVPAVVVAAAFAAAHGSPDPWILADLAVFSLTASIMTWRTGGLEAAIVMHAVNNVGIDLIVTSIGGFEEAFVGTETKGSPLSLAVSLLLHGLALALVLWQARRSGVQRWYRPTPISPAAPPTVAVTTAA
jgi:membrane protease YdiL (CAAX protease family)